MRTVPGFLGVVCIVLVGVAGARALTYADPRDAQAAAVAAKASPDLVNALAKEIGGTPEQAAGAAGVLFGVAKTRLTPEQFAQVAKAVPGMDELLASAPPLGGAVALSKGGLASATEAFGKLGLKPELVSKAVPVLTSFVSKSGGANVGQMLAGVLK